jgi:hypothetical protein
MTGKLVPQGRPVSGLMLAGPVVTVLGSGTFTFTSVSAETTK